MQTRRHQSPPTLPIAHLTAEEGIPGGLAVKNLLVMQAMQEMRVPSLGREDSPGEGNGIPRQYSCLENLMDRRAWRATVHATSKSRTQLKPTAGAPCEEGEAQGGPASPSSPGIPTRGWASGCGERVALAGKLPLLRGWQQRPGTPGKGRVGPEGPVTPAAVSGGFCSICRSWLSWDLGKLPF